MLLVKVPTGMGSWQGNPDTRLAPEWIAEKIPPSIVGKTEEVEVAAFDLEKTNENIYRKALGLLEENCFFIGGDHSITRPLFRAFAEKHDDSALVVFDAHADIGKKAHRLSHGAYIRTLVGEGILKNAMLAGILFENNAELSFIKKNRIELITLENINEQFSECTEKIKEFVGNFSNIYISIDMDVFSSGIAPAVGSVFNKGLDKKQFFSLYRSILESGKVGAIDLVEVNPARDEKNKTMPLCTDIIKEGFANEKQ